MEPGSQLEWRVSELEKDVAKMEDLPTDVALLLKSVEGLESRFKNLQRGFYFFGASVVTASIAFGFTALRVFANPPDPTSAISAAARVVGLG